MDERQIEDMLMRLENGEISEDDLESDGEDIPYYPSREALAAELEDDEEVLTGEKNFQTLHWFKMSSLYKTHSLRSEWKHKRLNLS